MPRIALILAALTVPLAVSPLPVPALAATAQAGPAQASPAQAAPAPSMEATTPAREQVNAPARAQADPTVAASDTRELDRKHFTLDGRQLPQARPRLSRSTRSRPATPAVTPPVGTVRQWLGLDDTDGTFYRKNYTLRGVGTHIEVWVAQDVAFPAGDCRKTGLDVTDDQIGGLISEFDGTIWPKETAAFSTPPDRDGQNPVLTGDFSGAGDKTVTLVDNVRDDNFYHFPAAATYIAGFFSAQLNELFDRNVMTIDAYDWLHRTGANPPSAPTTDLCTSRPARPRMYEGTFAHEWQHLLEYYADPDESTWVNEGLSDYAQTLVGYVDPALTVYHRGFDVHLTCFQGFGTVETRANANARDCGGPQNSLNLWNEGSGADVLADYGNAYQFMLYLHDRFGAAALVRLHRDREHHGLAGVSAALPAGTALYDVLHAYQTNVLTDRITGGTPSLRSTVNLLNPAAYDRPGAAPNGADYVRLRDARGHYLAGRDLRSVTFDGARTLPPQPLSWTVVDGALFSGNTGNLQAAAVTPVDVPQADPVLRFAARYGAEEGYDFGYVVVSGDGGDTYEAVPGDRTVPGPLGPGVNGTTDGFQSHAYDLAAYAGKKILIGFLYVSDASINLGGWSIKDITVGATVVPSTVDRFRSPTQIMPTPVHAWSVRLVGLNPGRVLEVPVRDWARLKGFDRIVAIVAYDEPTETQTQYAPYCLTVNGVAQPGGSVAPAAPGPPAAPAPAAGR